MTALADIQNFNPDEIQINLDRAADAAWNHYQETGLHLTHEELDAWLATWGTPNEQPMPECHT